MFIKVWICKSSDIKWYRHTWKWECIRNQLFLQIYHTLNCIFIFMASITISRNPIFKVWGRSKSFKYIDWVAEKRYQQKPSEMKSHNIVQRKIYWIIIRSIVVTWNENVFLHLILWYFFKFLKPLKYSLY